MEGKQVEEVNNRDGYEREAAPAKCRLWRERERETQPNTLTWCQLRRDRKPRQPLLFGEPFKGELKKTRTGEKEEMKNKEDKQN